MQRKPNISNRAKVSLFKKLHWPAVVVGVVEMMQKKKERSSLLGLNHHEIVSKEILIVVALWPFFLFLKNRKKN